MYVSPHFQNFRTFELQLVKVTSITPALTVANIYRPPQTSLSQFHTELADALSAIVSATDRLVVCGDFNCPGDGPTSIDPDVSAVFDSLNLVQHVHAPTRLDNLLDLVVTDQQLVVKQVQVDDAGLVSDHRLVCVMVSARLLFRRPVRSTSRRLCDFDTIRFENALHSSELFVAPATTVDGFADQLERVVVAELDRLAPLRTRSRRPPKPITRWLSKEAMNAKRYR